MLAIKSAVIQGTHPVRRLLEFSPFELGCYLKGLVKSVLWFDEGELRDSIIFHVNEILTVKVR